MVSRNFECFVGRLTRCAEFVLTLLTIVASSVLPSFLQGTHLFVSPVYASGCALSGAVVISMYLALEKCHVFIATK